MKKSINNKINFPLSSCDIKIPDRNNSTLMNISNEVIEFESRKQQLIKIADKVWGENEWNYAVTNQHTDFIDYVNGQYSTGVVTFLKIQLKNGIFREDIGYATGQANQKGLAIYRARKSSITNAFLEVINGFSGKISELVSELYEEEKKCLSESQKKGSDDSISEIIQQKDVTPSTDGSIRPEKILKLGNSSDVIQVPEDISLHKTSNKFSSRKTNLGTSGEFSEKLEINKSASLVFSIDSNTSTLLAPKLPLRPSVDNNKNLGSEHKNKEDISKAERLRRQKLKQEEFKMKLQDPTKS